MKRHILYLLIAIATASCSTTRRIPEGEQLYTGVKKVEIAPTASGEQIPAGLTSQLK